MNKNEIKNLNEEFEVELLTNIKNEISDLGKKVIQSRIHKDNPAEYKNLIQAYKEIVQLYHDVKNDINTQEECLTMDKVVKMGVDTYNGQIEDATFRKAFINVINNSINKDEFSFNQGKWMYHTIWSYIINEILIKKILNNFDRICEIRIGSLGDSFAFYNSKDSKFTRLLRINNNEIIAFENYEMVALVPNRIIIDVNFIMDYSIPPLCSVRSIIDKTISQIEGFINSSMDLLNKERNTNIITTEKIFKLVYDYGIITEINNKVSFVAGIELAMID